MPSASRPTRSRPLIIAHRGASAHAPDNSLEAYRLAVEHGADGIEVDVRLTADGIPVLHHDATIPDFGALIDSPFERLRELYPLIPTLDEVLPITGHLLLNIEVKNHPRDPDFDPGHRAAVAVAAWIADHNVSDRVLVSSFNPATVDRVKAKAPGVPTGVLLEHGRGLPDELRRAADRGHQWLLPRAASLRFRLSPIVTAAHAAGLKLGTWTVDGPLALRRLRRAGVDGVITNDPRAALRIYA